MSSGVRRVSQIYKYIGALDKFIIYCMPIQVRLTIVLDAQFNHSGLFERSILNLNRLSLVEQQQRRVCKQGNTRSTRESAIFSSRSQRNFKSLSNNKFIWGGQVFSPYKYSTRWCTTVTFKQQLNNSNNNFTMAEEQPAWEDKFDFDVHYCLSEGNFCYYFDTVGAEGDLVTLAIANDELPTQFKDKGKMNFTKEQATQVAKFFEEEETSGLEGNVFCTKEKYAQDALKELKLAADFTIAHLGEKRKIVPDFVTDLIVKGFANIEKPAFDEFLTPGDIYRYSIDIFNLECFDEVDPVSVAWVGTIAAKVSEASQGKVIVQQVKHGENFPEGVNSAVKELRLSVSNNEKTMYVHITPASNGWVFL